MFAAHNLLIGAALLLPTITNVTTSPFHPGDTITITGTNLNVGTTTVSIGGIAATSVSVSSSTSLTCVIGASTPSGSQNVTVTTGNGTSAPFAITIVVFVQPTLKGTTTATAASVALPAHNVGDLIVLWAWGTFVNNAPGLPTAGGTVPAWVTADSGTSSSASSETLYFVATATNHTSGSFTNCAGLVAMVLSGQKSGTPYGGKATSAGQSVSTTVTAPAITLTRADNTSQILHFFAKTTSGIIWNGTVPTGYVQQTSNSTALQQCAFNKTTTTSDGSVVATNNSGIGANGVGASIEILSH